MNKLLLTAALTGAVTAVLATPTLAAEREKCYGVATSGKNDCASADGKFSCAGQSTRDKDKHDWKYVTKGECEKMGGMLTAPKAK